VGITDVIGDMTGRFLAPLAAAGARLREGRRLHACGTTWAATVTGRLSGREGSRLGDRLSGHAIVRFSRVFFPPGAPLDLLGCAIRFRGARPLRVEPAILDQDLLLATVRRPWQAGIALALTDVRDFLGNRYWSGSPFRASRLGRVQFRLVPLHRSPPGGSPERRLELATSSGLATLVLEVASDRWLGADWRALAEIRLEARLPLDERALAFSPFRSGAGIEPAGLAQGLRRATYRAAQRSHRALGPPPDALPPPVRRHIPEFSEPDRPRRIR
jgi:hypothetical protein